MAVASSNVAGGTAPLAIDFDGSASTDANIDTYSWDFGNGDSDTGALVSYTYPTEGNFVATLTVTDTEGLSDTDTINISVTTENTTLNNTELKDIKIYPNPVGDEKLLINLSDFMNESIALGFYDYYGKLIFQNSVQEDHPEEIAIDVSFLSNGFYLLEITRVKNNEYTYKKLIKIQ